MQEQVVISNNHQKMSLRIPHFSFAYAMSDVPWALNGWRLANVEEELKRILQWKEDIVYDEKAEKDNVTGGLNQPDHHPGRCRLWQVVAS